jgi:hypothetical protein
MRLFVAAALLVSSLPLLGDGTLTVNGTTVKLNHAYATTKKNPFDKKKTDIVVLIADRELPANVLKDDFSVMEVRDKTKFNGVSAEIDPDKKVISAMVYSSSLKKMDQFSGSGSQEVALTTMTPSRVAGKLWMPKPGDFFENTYNYSVEFDVPIATAASLADAPPAGKPLPAGGGDARKAYDDYRKVIFAGDLVALRKMVAADRAKSMDDPDFKKMFPMIQMMEPKNMKYVNGTIDGNTATLNVTAKDGKEQSTGTVTMVLEAGKWKVANEQWKSKSE